MNLAWTVSVDESAVSYAVYRGLGETGGPMQLIGTTNATVFRDATTLADTLYWYQVLPFDSSGNIGAPSMLAQARTYNTANTIDESDPRFSFGIFSDTYSGQEGGMRRMLDEMSAWEPNLHLILSAGDNSTYQRVRGLIDQRLFDNLPGAAPEFPWFPAAGNHDEENQTAMDWWRDNWATVWTLNPELSRLARQLPGIRNFKRGPALVQTPAGLRTVNPGTIYSFDYKAVHFVVLDTYEQGIINDTGAGVYDLNGPNAFDPATSQLDWLVADLAGTAQPLKFVIGHNALVPPVYSYSLAPPYWSEHNDPFHMAQLAQVLADYNVTAYFFGHDHVPSRQLIDRAGEVVYARTYWTTENDPGKPFGNPAEWSDLQGPGKVWEIDSGAVYSLSASYTIVHVTDTEVTFDQYRSTTNQPPSVLRDSFTIPIPTSPGP